MLHHFSKPERANRVRLPRLPSRVRGRYRIISNWDVKRIILTRYGSLERFDAPMNSIYAVSVRLKIPYTTVWYTLKKFRERGHEFDFALAQGRPRREFPEDLVSDLCSTSLLQ